MSEIQIDIAGKRSWISSLAGGLACLTLMTLAAGSGQPDLLAFALFFLTLPMAALFLESHRLYRLRNLAIRLNEDGVFRIDEAGEESFLGWEHYGGFELCSTSWLERQLDPVRFGLAVRRRDGSSAFTIPWPTHSVLAGSQMERQALSRTAMMQFLNRQVPPGGAGLHPNLTDEQPLTWPRVARLFVIGFGLTASGGAWFYVRQSAELSEFMNTLLTLVASTCLLMGLMTFAGAIATVYLRHDPEPESFQPDLHTPRQGPSVEEHYLATGQKPVELKLGASYRTVDPERLACIFWKTLASPMLRVLPYAALLLVSLIALLHDVRSAEGIGLLLAASIVAGGAFFALSRAREYASTRLRSLWDTVMPLHDGLMISKPDGTSLTIASVKRRKLRLDPGVEEWRGPAGSYYIDLKHIYEVEQ